MRVFSFFRNVPVHLFGLFAAFTFVTESRAVPIIAVDMEPYLPGVQISLETTRTDYFPVDIVLIGDGVTLFDAVIFDVGFNTGGNNVVELYQGSFGPLIVARALAEVSPALTFDVFSATQVILGDQMASGGLPVPNGYGGSIGGAGLLSAGEPWIDDGYPIGNGREISILQFYLRIAPDVPRGSATSIDVLDALEGSPRLALAGSAVESEVQGATIHVPETGSTFLLLAAAVLVLSFQRWTAGNRFLCFEWKVRFGRFPRRSFQHMVVAVSLIEFSSVGAEYLRTYSIPLKSGLVTLQSVAVDSAQRTPAPAVRYVILQFRSAPNSEQFKELQVAGIHPLSFLYKNAWLSALNVPELTGALAQQHNIVAMAPWRPEYKIDPRLLKGNFAAWAITEEGSVRLQVTTFADVPRLDAERNLSQLSIQIALYQEPNVWAIQIKPEQIRPLIDLNEVQSVEEGPAPLLPTMAYARPLINAETAQSIDISQTPPVYQGLSGAGVVVQVSETVSTDHPDFWDYSVFPPVNRFLDHPRHDSGGGHGTVTAGIIGGNGWNSDKSGNPGRPFQWRGIAPEVTLITDSSSGFQPDVSNHSFWMYANYGHRSQSIDNFIRGGSASGWRWLQVWSAGNQGLSPIYSPEKGYYAIAPAKNVVCVGAVNADDASLSDFSSLGPTFDGRIKPDVVAGGSKDPLYEIEFDYIRIIDTLSGSVDRAWEFNVTGDSEGWFQIENHNTLKDVALGRLSLKARPGSYGAVYDLDLEANTNHVIEIRYRVEPPAGLFDLQPGVFHWALEDTGDYVDGNISFDVIIDGSYHVVQIPVGELGRELGPAPNFEVVGPGGWKSTITKLIVSPVSSGGIIGPRFDSQGYWGGKGTSQSAPAVTGTAALMLQQFVESYAINLDLSAPLPSTIKAILIHTAEDLVHNAPYTDLLKINPVNPDTGAPVLYFEGPDFATGYGLVNAKEAVDFIQAASINGRLLEESNLDVGQTEIFELDVPPGLQELKVTLTWDDMEASTSLGDQRIRRLVNDLDLVLISPEKQRCYPWQLDPPPAADCKGAGPGCGDLDPIKPGDIKPAGRGPDHRNNIEQVLEKSPVPGKWYACVRGVNIQAVPDGPQDYSIVGTIPRAQWSEKTSLPPQMAEEFKAGINPFDLSNRSLMFKPDGAGSYDTFWRTATVFPTSLSGAIHAVSGQKVTLGGGMKVRLYGLDYDSLYINDTGLTFNGADPSPQPAPLEHFSQSRVAVLTSSDPPGGLQISYRQLSDRIMVAWTSRTGEGDFQAELFFDGRIRMTWLKVLVDEALVGLSEGTGFGAIFVGEDLSEFPEIYPDLNGDFLVNILDLSTVASAYDKDPILFPQYAKADVDWSGKVDAADLKLVRDYFGQRRF